MPVLSSLPRPTDSRPSVPITRPIPLETFDQLQQRKDWRTYCERSPLGNHRDRWVSIYGLRGRVFVLVTDGVQRRVEQLKFPAAATSLGISTIQVTAVLALADRLGRGWVSATPDA